MPIEAISTEGSFLYYMTIIIGALITGAMIALQNRRNMPKTDATATQPQEYRFIVDGTQGVLSIEEWMQNLVTIPIVVMSLDLHLTTKYKDIRIIVTDYKPPPSENHPPDISGAA